MGEGDVGATRVARWPVQAIVLVLINIEEVSSARYEIIGGDFAAVQVGNNL